MDQPALKGLNATYSALSRLSFQAVPGPWASPTVNEIKPLRGYLIPTLDS